MAAGKPWIVRRPAHVARLSGGAKGRRPMRVMVAAPDRQAGGWFSGSAEIRPGSASWSSAKAYSGQSWRKASS